MLNLKTLQKEILQSKVDKGFNATDVNLEFCYIYAQLGVAYEAFRKKKSNSGEELAEIAIFLLGLSEMLDIELEDEILKKMVKNKKKACEKVNRAQIRVSE
ncbi:MAG: hypothetical protein A2Y18_08530 [Clostridiales bacterium GWD2_32_19]|nr:MAG: hypothetical protein A2Y18_08530 [Clostridiales bacterium GWD2_32_19]